MMVDKLLFVKDSIVSERLRPPIDGKLLREKVLRGFFSRFKNYTEGKEKSVNEVKLLFLRSSEVMLFRDEPFTAKKKVDTPQPLRSTETLSSFNAVPLARQALSCVRASSSSVSICLKDILFLRENSSSDWVL